MYVLPVPRELPPENHSYDVVNTPSSISVADIEQVTASPTSTNVVSNSATDVMVGGVSAKVAEILWVALSPSESVTVPIQAISSPADRFNTVGSIIHSVGVNTSPAELLPFVHSGNQLTMLSYVHRHLQLR